MIETTRRFPRTLREVLPPTENAIGITGPVVIQTRAPLWVRLVRAADAWLLKLAEARKVYAQYRQHHSATYAARIAYQVAFRGLPF